MGKKIMIIGAGALQVPAIIKAKEMGLEVIALDMDPKAPGFSYADTCLQISTIDIEKAVAVAEKLKPDGVMTIASDMPMRTVAAIGEACGLATISKETAYNATNKGRMREQLKKYNIPIPEFYVTTSYEDFFTITNELKGKFIVKPADNSGSRGIFLVNENYDLKEVYNYSKVNSRSGEVLIEEYMIGAEVSVETFTVNGKTNIIAITDKLTTGAPYFVEMGHSIPSALTSEIKKSIEKTAIQAIDALGINNGPTHTEIIVTKDGPKIVEIGARLGGDYITTHLVPMATGINLVECCIKVSLGEKPDITCKKSYGAAIRYFKCPHGKIVSIEGFEDAQKIPGIKEIYIAKKVGELVNPIHSSTDRIGFVIANGNTSFEATKICNEAMKLLKIKTSNLINEEVAIANS